jgi:hypothetical protein
MITAERIAYGAKSFLANFIQLGGTTQREKLIKATGIG